MYRQTMQITLLTLVVALLSAPLSQAYLAVEEEPVGETTQPTPTEAPGQPVVDDMTVRVVSTQGRAFYRMAETDEWAPIQTDDVLPVGATIRTGLRGKVALALGPNADFEVKPLTEMTISDLEKDGDTIRTQLVMPRGNFNMDVKHVGFQNDFKIATPTGTMAVKGTGSSGFCYGNGLTLNPSVTNKDNAINHLKNNGQSENVSGGEQMNNGQSQSSPNNQGQTGTGQTGTGNDSDGSKGGDTGGSDGLNNATGNLQGSSSFMGTMTQVRKIKDFLGDSS